MPRVSEAYLRARREEILAAATRCFQRDGFAATQMKHIAAEADVSVGVIYRYFGGKTELAQAVIDRSRVADRANRERDMGTGTPVQRMANLVEAHRERMVDRDPETEMRASFRAFGEAASMEDGDRLVSDYYRDGKEQMAAVVAEARDAGEIRRDVDPGAFGSAFLSQFVAVGFQRLFDETFDPHGAHAAILAMLNGVVTAEGRAALRARARHPRSPEPRGDAPDESLAD